MEGVQYCDQKSFTVMSLHINNNYAKKRGIGKKLLLTIRAVMLEEHVDLVDGDFNGAAWRRATSANTISIIEEAFADWLADASWPHTIVGVQERCRVRGRTCADFSISWTNERRRVRQHGAFPIHHDAQGIRQTDQSCHHEVCLPMDFVERRNGRAHHETHERRLYLKERSAP